MSNTVQVIDELQREIHRVLSPLVPRSGKFALLDFPNHGNIGDSAIWLGEIEYFKNWHNLRPSFVSHFGRHSSAQLKKAVPSGPIFIHGGEKFGDISTTHQDFREKMIQEFPDRKIIQLPQSLHFEDWERLQETARIINAHPDFTLLVQDRESYAVARNNFKCKVFLCPNMTFAIGTQNFPQDFPRPLLFILSPDKNYTDSNRDYWPTQKRNSNVRIHKWPKLNLRMLNRFAIQEFFYSRLARQRVEDELIKIGSADFIICDSLQAHILSVLSDIPHVILNNEHENIGSFIETWTTDISNMTQASELEEALDIYNSSSIKDNQDARRTLRLAC